MKKCKTPGSRFHINIVSNRVGCYIDLPFKIELNESQAIDLENEIQDAIENVLAQFFKQAS